MAAAYNRRPGVGQPPGPARRDGGAAAESAADLLLLASCAAADREAEARVERRLRGEALRFVAAAPRGVLAEARRSLELLLDDAAADHAAVLVVRLADGASRRLLDAGSGHGAALLGPVPPPLREGVRVAARSGRAVEAPLLDAVAGSGPLPTELLEHAGIRALRWSCRAVGADRAFVVALHVAAERRCWTPLRRQFHDGMTDVLAAALPAGRPDAGSGGE